MSNALNLHHTTTIKIKSLPGTPGIELIVKDDDHQEFVIRCFQAASVNAIGFSLKPSGEDK